MPAQLILSSTHAHPRSNESNNYNFLRDGDPEDKISGTSETPVHICDDSSSTQKQFLYSKTERTPARF